MQRRKEMEMLIARYMTDIAALEEREEDLMRQSDILENLIPDVLVSYMGKVIQTSQDKPIPEQEIETEVREKLEHLKGVLKELQQVIGLVKEEKSIMRKRIKELELFLAAEPGQIIDIDPPAPVPAQVPEKTKTGKVDEKKPKGLKTEEFDDQQVKFKELLQSENTDWKKVYEDLQKQVFELTENLNNSSKKLKESKGYIKNLEDKYSNLKKELQAQAKMEKKTGSLTLDDAIGKEPEKFSADQPETHSDKIVTPVSKPGILDEKSEKTIDSNIDKSKDQQERPEELLQSKDNTDWEKVCQDLQTKIIELTKKINSSSQKLKETEGYKNNLWEEYSKLKKELKINMRSMEKKTDTLISAIVNKEQEKTARRDSQKDLVGKSPESEKNDTVSGVSSMKEALTKSPKYKQTCVLSPNVILMENK